MSEWARHPWNAAFEWRSPSPPYRVLSDAQAAQFDSEGYVVLEGVLDHGERAELIDELDALEAGADAFLQRQDGGRMFIAETGAITFGVHAVLRSEAAKRLSRHPVLVGLCHDLVGPDVNLYWDQLVYKKPEKPRRFPWHQDNGYTFVEPQQYLTCWVALTEATLDNGCPWVAPGLHRQGTLRHRYVDPLGWECFEAPNTQVAAPVGAGGVVVFSSLTPHLTGPNVTGDVRKAYIIQYAPVGAEILDGDPAAGPPTGTRPADDPDRQYAIVRNGAAV